MFKFKFDVVGIAEVDGATWYTLRMGVDELIWLRKQNPALWYEHLNTSSNIIVDMHESLYTMGALKWA